MIVNTKKHTQISFRRDSKESVNKNIWREKNQKKKEEEEAVVVKIGWQTMSSVYVLVVWAITNSAQQQQKNGSNDDNNISIDIKHESNPMIYNWILLIFYIWQNKQKWIVSENIYTCIYIGIDIYQILIQVI